MQLSLWIVKPALLLTYSHAHYMKHEAFNLLMSDCDSLVMIRASSIPQHADFHTKQQNSPFAVKFASCCRKMQNCPYFATYISNSRFFGLLFNFIIYKTMNSTHCKLTFMTNLWQYFHHQWPNVMCFRVTGYNKFLIVDVLSVNTTTPIGHRM